MLFGIFSTSGSDLIYFKCLRPSVVNCRLQRFYCNGLNIEEKKTKQIQLKKPTTYYKIKYIQNEIRRYCSTQNTSLVASSGLSQFTMVKSNN